MKQPRNASGNATSEFNASVGLSPIQTYTSVVSYHLFLCLLEQKDSFKYFSWKQDEVNLAHLKIVRREKSHFSKANIDMGQ